MNSSPVATEAADEGAEVIIVGVSASVVVVALVRLVSTEGDTLRLGAPVGLETRNELPEPGLGPTLDVRHVTGAVDADQSTVLSEARLIVVAIVDVRHTEVGALSIVKSCPILKGSMTVVYGKNSL